MKSLTTYGSVLLAMLLLLHSLTASVVCLDFTLHQEEIAQKFCFHQAGSENFCQGDGICQLHLRLQKVENNLQGHTPQQVKPILPEQVFIFSIDSFCYQLSSRLVLFVQPEINTLLPAGYTLAVDSPPRLA